MAKQSVRPRRPKKTVPTSDPNDIKAWLVETITKWLHDSPLLDVYHDAWVTTTEGTAKRQIDVLIRPHGSEDRATWTVVECKNYGKRIDELLIDGFFGALDDIGVPASQGFFVAVKEKGYTKEAKRRAKKAGITLLELTGIETVKRLTAQVYKALQSVVFLVADISKVTLVNDLHEPIKETGSVYDLYNDEGQSVAVPDLVWQGWRGGMMPAALGTHFFGLLTPQGLHSVIEGEKYPIEAMGIVVKVTGYIHTVEGEANEHALLNAEDQTVHKYGAKIKFSLPQGEVLLTPIPSEADLESFIASHPAIHLVHRVPLPRILFMNAMYWPPSERVWNILIQRGMQMEAGFKVPPATLRELEGTRINTAWEPISREYLEQWEDAAQAGNMADIKVDLHWTRHDPAEQSASAPVQPEANQ